MTSNRKNHAPMPPSGSWRPCQAAAALLLLGATAAAAPAPRAAHPMDYPIALATQASQAYQQVRDYRCAFIKHEQIAGQLQPECVMDMRFRAQPFSVYFNWQSPRSLAGQEACYVAGQNNNMVRVHPNGLRGAVGFVSLENTDPRVTSQSRHPITDAGIGNLINSLMQNWTRERGLNQTQVKIAEYDFARRRCIRVELIHPENTSRQFYAYRTVVYFDRENHLPIRVESYDWPRRGGQPQGDLIESYSYVGLRVNVGFGDAAFKY